MYLGWFDDDAKKPTAEKVREAAERYAQKFGRAPTVCLVNEAQLVGPVDGVEVRSVVYVRPNHFWVGRYEEPSVAVLSNLQRAGAGLAPA